MRAVSAAVCLLTIGSACSGGGAGLPHPIPDEPTRLEQTLAVALLQRDSLTLARFLSPDFVLLGVDTTLPPIPRATWLKNSLHDVHLDSVAVRDVVGTWKGDTLTTVLWLFYRGKAGEKVIPPEEAELQDRWLLEGDSRWQLLSRRTLRWRPVVIDSAGAATTRAGTPP